MASALSLGNNPAPTMDDFPLPDDPTVADRDEGAGDAGVLGEARIGLQRLDQRSDALLRAEGRVTERHDERQLGGVLRTDLQAFVRCAGPLRR